MVSTYLNSRAAFQSHLLCSGNGHRSSKLDEALRTLDVLAALPASVLCSPCAGERRHRPAVPQPAALPCRALWHSHKRADAKDPLGQHIAAPKESPQWALSKGKKCMSDEEST